MLFSSIPFLYYFLPIVLICYFLSPKKIKNTVLLISSLIFYGWGEPKYVFLMAATIVLGYAFGLLTEKYREADKKKSKIFTAVSVSISLLFLIYFKYTDFFISAFASATGLSLKLLNIALPVGISFYTFQIISYNIDVYRGEKAQKNIINLAAYVTMFPQLIAGPIVRYSDIALQLNERKHSFRKASEGITRFVIGLAKKILLANQLGEICDAYRSADEKTVLFAWLYAVAYCLHIYFDFSGYSDMAIGLGKILGFDFLENFNYPFISKSITEFWRRWHMSLGTWFRDYVYIPLGGNRVSVPRHYFNIFVVWFLTGFWHGANWNFMIWGLYFAVLLMVEKRFLLKLYDKIGALSRIPVLLLVIISFIIFDSTKLSTALESIGSLFGIGSSGLVNAESLYLLKSYAPILIAGLIGSTPLVKKAVQKLSDGKGKIAVSVLEPVFNIVILIIITAYLVDGSFNPFLYFRF